MKIFLNLIFILFLTSELAAREKGETEISTEDGIEVYQNEKYYLLKKNVKIESDNFTLNADKVKVYFNENLYDIIEINAEGNARFKSDEFKMRGNGEFLNIKIKIEEIQVKGEGSELVTDNINMYSNGSIRVSNSTGNFFLKGLNSKLKNESIIIKAEDIEGNFDIGSNPKQINTLYVSDKKRSYIETNNSKMYAKKINFNKSTSIIELIENVKIDRNGQIITGDYGTLDTENNSYKIKSKNQTKVKAIIKNDE